jgi:hypothetical protein
MTQSSPLAEVAAEIAALEQDLSLLLPESLNEREQAFTLLAFLGDLLEERAGPDAAAEAGALRARISALSSRFEAATARLADGVRLRLRAGELRGASLRAMLDRFTAYRANAPGFLHLNYEPADVLVGALLGLDRPIPEELPREKGMVHLEFSPVSVVLEMVDRLALGPGDLFVDLGAGLGQVVLLYHLLTAVPGQGIERQPSYCAAAREMAAEFGAPGIGFVAADARQADYRQGTAFYLFTPFHGAVLQSVLDRLRATATHPGIRICTYGPCTLEVARQSWLRSVDLQPPHPSRLSLFAVR